MACRLYCHSNCHIRSHCNLLAFKCERILPTFVWTLCHRVLVFKTASVNPRCALLHQLIQPTLRRDSARVLFWSIPREHIHRLRGSVLIMTRRTLLGILLWLPQTVTKVFPMISSTRKPIFIIRRWGVDLDAKRSLQSKYQLTLVFPFHQFLQQSMILRNPKMHQ